LYPPEQHFPLPPHCLHVVRALAPLGYRAEAKATLKLLLLLLLLELLMVAALLNQLVNSGLENK
jgi:hypothetical protein